MPEKDKPERRPGVKNLRGERGVGECCTEHNPLVRMDKGIFYFTLSIKGGLY